MGLIKVALILALIYYILKIFSRYFIRNLFKKHQQQYEAQTGYQQERKEGDISIDYSTNNKKQGSDGIGEYVDYEEVKDE